MPGASFGKSGAANPTEGTSARAAGADIIERTPDYALKPFLLASSRR